MVQLDSTNLRLLELLQEDARTSIIDLARAVDRAESTVRERIAALEREGVLLGYRALVDPEKLGHRARAVVRAGGDRRRFLELAKRLAAIPNVVGAQLTTGPKPLLIEIVAESLPRLEQVVEERLAPLELEGLEMQVVLRAVVGPRPLPVHAAPAGPPAAVPLEPVRALLPPAAPEARRALPLTGAVR